MTDIYWIIKWIKGTVPMYYCGDTGWSFIKSNVHMYSDKQAANNFCVTLNKKLDGYCMVTEVIINDE